MKIKKYLFCLAMLVLAAGPAWAQVTHITDDRELFVGVGDASKILPNIMVLADNSGSMNTAIYHPDYLPGKNYKVDASGHALTLTENLTNMTNMNASGSIRYLNATTTFNICRGVPHYTITYDARGTYGGQLRNNPRRWRVNKGSGTFAVGQTIMYDGWGSGVNDLAQITVVIDHGTYWEITVNTGTPGWGGNPDANSYVYINYQQVVDYTDMTLAEFNEVGVACSGGAVQISNVKLFGTVESGANTRYDENYLYWLAFHTNPPEDPNQIAQVTYWATTGMYPDKNGTLVYFGYYRIQVERQVLHDVVMEVYQTVNMGLAIFNGGDNPDGGQIAEPMSNMNNLGTRNAFLGKIGNLLADTWTPLAETMADIWYYYKGGTGGSYWPNDGTNSNCGSATGGGFPTTCPIQYTCQKNYVIIMTDGQSTQDLFDNAKYSGSIFTSDLTAMTWGDGDNHETPPPANTAATNSDGTPYCPLDTCRQSNGSDYLDDMAYFMKHNDLFPDALYPGMPGDQSIETFVIGFNMDNDMLRDTARNGKGEYYTANSYDDLKNALKDAITNILLRNFGFAAFTAPKKISSVVGEGFSFIGYFLPSAAASIWEGHLQSYKMTDKWCADANANNTLDGDECLASYTTQTACETANPGLTCMRNIALSATSEWDARDKMTLPRSLWTHNTANVANPYGLINFTDPANIPTPLQTLFGLPADVAPDTTYQTQAQTIVSTLSAKILGDIFHSDIAYVGPPLPGKRFVKNLNPVECNSADKASDPDCYEKLLADQGVDPDVPGSGRLKVIYVGTNEGILHQVNATTGVERWGFIPDEVLPSLKKIVIDKEFTYTVDGHLTADDIYYRSGTGNSWKTILVFGLKDGGNSFYALDVTIVGTQPVVLWKFPKDDTFSEYNGKSWSKPYVGKIKYWDTVTSKNIDRWVVIVAGGMAFNNDYNGDTRGKAIFVIDASSGELIWMIGYNYVSGAAENNATTYIDTLLDPSYTGPGVLGVRYLTAKTEFNYAVPSAITPVDRDSDGYLDTVYFGNVAGHLFKTDISANDPNSWKTYQLFKKDISTTVQSQVESVTGTVVRVASAAGFALHQNVFGQTSKAMGIIDAVSNRDLTIEYRPTSGGPTFQLNEQIVVPTLDPIFLSPAVAFDPCYNLWVAFGTGDRLRSRTNPTSGKFAAIRDGSTLVGGAQVQKTDILLSDLVTLTWSGNVINPTNIKVANKWGWQFTFPDAANYEKLFDPEPLILPDTNLVPHIYFNTYQPPLAAASEDCNAPKEGMMNFYDLTLNYCGTGKVAAIRESGRIAGGGMFQGSDFILYEGTGNVASVPPLQKIKPIKLLYTGGLLFWKEKKR